MANYLGPRYGHACSVLQRRAKQVYFQLNPFLERTNLKDEDAEDYQPTSKFVVPLPSIVICEKFDSEDVKDRKILKTDQFWEYLYSDNWGDDCSLRVLEGELLELLTMLLCIMEKEGKITSHLTFGYAKNKRQANKFYKHAERKKEDCVTETLLVEFVYFGVNGYGKAGQEKGDDVVGWKEYDVIAAQAAGLTKLVDIVHLLSQMGKTNKENKDSFSSITRPPKSIYSLKDESRGIGIDPRTLVRWQEIWGASNKRNKNQGQSPTPTERSVVTSPRDKSLHNITEDGTELLAKIDKMLNKRPKPLGRTKRNTTFTGGLTGKRVPPGNEFYINQYPTQHQEEIKTADLLQERKQRVALERQREVQQIRKLDDTRLSMSEKTSNESDDKSQKPLLKLYDKKASFGDFYKYLAEVNKFDQRLKKAAQRKKKLLEKFKKERRESKMSGLKSKRSSVISVASKTSKVFASNDKRFVPDRKKFAGEVGGVTDSAAAKRHCLQNTTSTLSIKEEPKVITSKDIRSNKRTFGFQDNTFKTLPKIISPIFEKESKPDSKLTSIPKSRNKPTEESENHSKPSPQLVVKVPTHSKKSPVSVSDTDSESTDSEKERENDGFVDTVFDTKKLNKKYSIEKIRSIKQKRDKKPPVINILRKFCRVNRLMNTLTPKPTASKTPRKSITDSSKSKQANKAFGIYRRLNKKSLLPEAKPEVEIGKLKKFNFLKMKDHKINDLEVNLPNFETFSVDRSKKLLLQALKDFVIRKEKVTTSYTYEKLTTITFTRPAAYLRMYEMSKTN